MSEQQARRVRIVNNISSSRDLVETSATTFGELKEEFPSYFRGDVKAILRETRTTLELDDAKLPEFDFTLFLVAKKVKSGVDYSSWGYHQLRAECADRDSIPTSKYNGPGHSNESMREALIEDDKSDRGLEERIGDILQTKKDEAQAEINSLLSGYGESLVEDFFGDYEEEIQAIIQELPDVQ